MNTPSKPFLPVVSAKEFCAYRSGCPETYTVSPIVNAVCEAFEQLGLVSCHAINRYLQLESRKLTYAIEVETGYTLTEFRKKIVDDRIARCRREFPHWNAEQIAVHLGFSDRSVVWHRIKEDNIPVSYTATKTTFTRDEMLTRLEEVLDETKEINPRAVDKFLREIGKTK